MRTGFLILAAATLILAAALTWTVVVDNSPTGQDVQYVDIPREYQVDVPGTLEPVPTRPRVAEQQTRVTINKGGQ